MKLPQLPRKKTATTLIQAELDQELGESLRAELKKNGVKICDFLDWAARVYLLNSNPKEAQKLGIGED